MSNWQPIATAPQSTPLLICFADGQMAVAMHRGDLTYWTDPDGLDFHYGDDVPTWWMTLPEAPK